MDRGERLILYGGLALFALAVLRPKGTTGSRDGASAATIALPGPIYVNPGDTVAGQTPGTDQTDWSPAWTGSGDPSNTDIYNPSAMVLDGSGELNDLPGSPSGPVALTP